MLGRILSKVAAWALARNQPGSYAGEDDRRWAYTIEVDGEKYLTRILLPRVLGVRVMLHHILRPDSDRNLHNHPWRWARSIVLCGAYDEERLEQVVETVDHEGREYAVPLTVERTVRRHNKITEHDYHRITRLHGDVWTLFITGTRAQDWGFLVDGVHVPWRKYLGKE